MKRAPQRTAPARASFSARACRLQRERSRFRFRSLSRLRCREWCGVELRGLSAGAAPCCDLVYAWRAPDEAQSEPSRSAPITPARDSAPAAPADPPSASASASASASERIQFTPFARDSSCLALPSRAVHSSRALPIHSTVHCEPELTPASCASTNGISSLYYTYSLFTLLLCPREAHPSARLFDLEHRASRSPSLCQLTCEQHSSHTFACQLRKASPHSIMAAASVKEQRATFPV